MTLFLSAFWILLNGLRDTLPLLLAAAVHEAGHYLACLNRRVPVRFFSPLPVGVVLSFDPTGISYRTEAFIALAGPIAGLFAAGFSLLLPGCRFTALFAFSSLALSVFNLLPIHPLDGFIFLRAVLFSWLDPMRGERILSFLSTLGIVFLWMFSAAVQLRCGGNLSLLMISVYMMLSLAFPTR